MVNEMVQTEQFSLADVHYMHRVIVGNDNPETAANEEKIQAQLEHLNR